MTMIMLAAICASQVRANADYFRSQDLDVAPALPITNYWSSGFVEPSNSTLGFETATGCSFCGEFFYHEPPPDDIIYIPSPPLHPSFQNAISADTPESVRQQNGDQCNFCNIFYDESEQLANLNNPNRNFSSVYIVGFGSLVAIVAVIFLYLVGIRKPRIILSFARTTVFKSQHAPIGNHHQMNKNDPLANTLPHPGVNMSDPCYLQTGRDKSRTSPIINDNVSHKKTAIPSKCWAQPGSIVNRTVRRVPNEYEIPSSRTNSTGASSALYADTAYDHNQHNHNNARFFSPYNLHTYAEVREVLDPNEHFHTSSNSSAMLSESNYDNALIPHQGNLIQNVPNGTVQMSDFNSMRPQQSVQFQPLHMNHHQTLNHPHQTMSKVSNGQSIYEQPQQRAQLIITSNNQGMNPVILNHRDKIHNVI